MWYLNLKVYKYNAYKENICIENFFEVVVAHLEEMLRYCKSHWFAGFANSGALNSVIVVDTCLVLSHQSISRIMSLKPLSGLQGEMG